MSGTGLVQGLHKVFSNVRMHQVKPLLGLPDPKLTLFGEEVVSIMIWNKTIAKSFLEHFAIMWRSARPLRVAMARS